MKFMPRLSYGVLTLAFFSSGMLVFGCNPEQGHQNKNQAPAKKATGVPAIKPTETKDKSFFSENPFRHDQDRGITVVEPWIENLTQGSIQDYRSLVKELDAGRLPNAMRSTLISMKSSIDSLLQDSRNHNPAQRKILSKQGAELKNSLRNHLGMGLVPGVELFRKFAAFVEGARKEDKILDLDQKWSRLGLDPDEAKKIVELNYHFFGEFSPLSIKQINRMQGLRFFPIGLTLDEQVEYDGLVSGPLQFASHDVSHALGQIRAYKSAYKFLRTRLPNDQAIAKAFEDTQMAFRVFMADLERENLRIAQGTEAVFFYLTHEGSSIELFSIEPTTFMRLLNKGRLKASWPVQISPFSDVSLSEDDLNQIGNRLNRFFKSQMFRFGLLPRDNVEAQFYENLLDWSKSWRVEGVIKGKTDTIAQTIVEAMGSRIVFPPKEDKLLDYIEYVKTWFRDYPSFVLAFPHLESEEEPPAEKQVEVESEEEPPAEEQVEVESEEEPPAEEQVEVESEEEPPAKNMVKFRKAEEFERIKKSALEFFDKEIRKLNQK